MRHICLQFIMIINSVLEPNKRIHYTGTSCLSLKFFRQQVHSENIPDHTPPHTVRFVRLLTGIPRLRLWFYLIDNSNVDKAATQTQRIVVIGRPLVLALYNVTSRYNVDLTPMVDHINNVSPRTKSYVPAGMTDLKLKL